MKALLVGLTGSLLVAAAPVLASPCSDRLADMQKSVSAMDAGSGPAANAQNRQTSDTTGSVGSGASGSQGSGLPNARHAEVPKAGEAPKTNVTVDLNQMTANRATSPQDVRQQMQNEPTTGEAAQSGVMPQDKQGRINALMQQARTADQGQDAAGCDQALRELDTLLGAGSR
jgi:hypothetical protein